MGETYIAERGAYILPNRRILVPGYTAGSEPAAGVVVYYDALDVYYGERGVYNAGEAPKPSALKLGGRG